MSNVKLGIRVRPFTERELKSERDHTSVVNVVDDHTVTITNVKVSASGAGDSRERVRNYFADYTFDSACSASDPAYASQEKVFETIGQDVIEVVSRGLSACVLAYGQSATGKTYTMMGTEAQPGLLPRLCRALASDQSLDVTVSFLEIYNERVHDLLAEAPPVACHSLPRRRGNARKDLRVREHPSRGPYVQNLRRVAVTDVSTLLTLVEEGARRRRTAATRRNATSSRSHALLELATSKATLHLADLAGSEKASWEGCGGGRQKEGANINKSLVALSNVISALVSGGTRGRFVPYRDSALTWLLKDCFTGGASTFIIATVSPSVACYGESASTLRWAARARQLRTPRSPIHGPSAVSRAALQAQLAQLITELTRYHISYIPESGRIIFEDLHWTLHKAKDGETPKLIETDTKIGNIMNTLKSKTETHNSESTASSSVASGSSDAISSMDKNVDLKSEVSKEVDKLFGPALERTRSGSDLGVIAPLRNKRKQYKSQEMLPIDKTLQIHDVNIDEPPKHSQESLNTSEGTSTKKVPILYDNQRAEIVASVTERLYSKLKKREEAAVSKMESVVDRKIVEPLSELRICTNARQRLMELSQKAMRSRRRIGIPAHTQTRLIVTRVREQGTDVQTDLGTYILKKDYSFTLQRDVATETTPITPRCKEVAVGPKSSSLNYRDSETITDQKTVIRKNSFMNTDIIPKCNRCSQTQIVPPPRRKRRASKISKHIHKDETTSEFSGPPVISINISQHYPESQSLDSESQSSDDDMVRRVIMEHKSKATNIQAPPDLLTNHNTADCNVYEKEELHEFNEANVDVTASRLDVKSITEGASQETDDFPEPRECSLPRVTPDPSNFVAPEDIKHMILGRNDDVYPYNIVLSPSKEMENKRVVKFQESVIDPVHIHTSQVFTGSENNNYKATSSSDVPTSKDDCNDFNYIQESCSDSLESSNADDDSFIWKSYQKTPHFRTISKGYTPVYKSNTKYKSARTKIYKEFLGLDTDTAPQDEGSQLSSMRRAKVLNSSDSTENEKSRLEFMERRQFFENKLNRRKHTFGSGDFSYIEKGILDSCNSLDAAVNKYEDYLTGFYKNEHYIIAGNSSRRPVGRTPTQYLHHLVNLRRELVKDCEISESSSGISRK